MGAKILAVQESALQDAVQALKDSKLVVFPTETVYGLGANALDGEAVAKVFEAKGRPSFNPLIVHVPDIQIAQQYAVFSDKALALAEAFWPGPLTFVLPRKADCSLSELVSAGLPTVAIRIPAHDTAQALLRLSHLPIAAPSANLSGRLSPTTPKHVIDDLNDQVDIILADGACGVGLESTVIDASGSVISVLRPGAITPLDLTETLGEKVSYMDQDVGDQPQSPGQLLKHYAPRTPIRLNAVDVQKGEVLLGFGSLQFMGVEGGGFAKDMKDDTCLNLSEKGDLYEAASNLFTMLHKLDALGAKSIAVMSIPKSGVGYAINDRLARAARG